MKTKKIVSFFLTVCMILSMLPTSVFAVGTTPPADTEKWIQLPTSCYTEVGDFTYPDATKYEGFVVTAGTSDDAKTNYLYADSADDNMLVPGTVDTSQEVPQLWYYEPSSGHFYTDINGQRGYLVIWYYPDSNNPRAYVAMANWHGNAMEWRAEVVNGDTYIYRINNNTKYYLDLSNGAAALVRNATPVKIYAHMKHEYDAPAGYAILSGTTAHTFSVGTEVSKITEAIQSGAAVWHDSNVNDNTHSTATKVDWSNVATSWDKPLDPSTEGTYTMSVTYGAEMLGKISVTIQLASLTAAQLTGTKVINIDLNGSPSYAGVSARLTYDDSSTTTVNASQLTFHTEHVDVTKTGVYPVAVYYHGHLLGSVFVRVSGDPYSHLKDEGADDIPEYPEPGAVRWDKTVAAFRDSESGASYVNTGVAQLELTTAGMNRPGNVDVVLVVDVSNSMGWSIDWFEGMTEAQASAAKDNVKIPKNGTAGETKLDIAMASAAEFASILLDNDLNNTLSFVTFAGQNSTENSYIDSVQTPFVGVRDSALASTAFRNTKFTNFVRHTTDGVENGSVTYTLQIGNTTGGIVTSGTNRGNTNYDYAFGEASNAVSRVKNLYGGAAAYKASGRELYVVFMTDGAPSHYNGKRASNVDSTDLLWSGSGNYTAITGDSSYVYDAWTQYILQHNELAESLNNQVNGFYPVGFDIAHGGFGVHSWDVHVMGNVLRGLVSDSEDLDIQLAEDSQSLHNFFRITANRFVQAGTSANVMDTISSHFTLFTGVEPNTANTAHLNAAKAANEITVKRYALYTKDDIGHTDATGQPITDDMVGQRRKGTDGKDICEVLEKVTFSADGTAAYSDLLHSENIRFTDSKGNLIIAGVYFTYTKTPGGVETFDWNIGPITEDEMALSYYVYLKGAKDNTFTEAPTNQIYPTNESARLEYVDLNGKHATRIYPVPELPWDSASVTVRFYLVNEQGEFINHAGVTFTNPANRVFLPNTYTYAADWSSTERFVRMASEAHSLAGVTTYHLYDDAHSFAIKFGSDMIVDGVHHKEAGSFTSTFTTGKANSDKLVMYHASDDTLQYTVVEFPVVMANLGQANNRLFTRQLVIDYGKSVEFDPFLAGERTGLTATNYKMELVGFAPYDAARANAPYDANPNDAQHEPSLYDYILSTAFSSTLHSANGRYEIVRNETGNLIRFTPHSLLREVEKVFAAVKFTYNDGKGNNYFYMFKPVYIIPATVMYYETDFGHNVFSMDGNWSSASSTPAADAPQNVVDIGNDLYGFDTTYQNDQYLSNGGAFKALGDSPDGAHPTTYATFDFTGTGFDIVGRTGDQQGLIVVTVTDHGSGTVRRKFKVLNKSERNLELYQIPVVSMNDLPHGSYTVTIDVIEAFALTADLQAKLPGFTNLSTEDQTKLIESMRRGGEFYFDAVRIYNPMNVKNNNVETLTSAAPVAGSDEAIAYAAYVADGEAHRHLLELRNRLIANGSFNGDGNSVTFADRQSTVTISEYAAIGPNNEVYLTGSQTIGFVINLGVAAPKSIHIAAKSADGKPVQMTTSVFSGTNTLTRNPVTINTCTELFYDLVSDYSKLTANSSVYVAIRNTGAGTLSLTDLKIAYGDTAGTASVTVDSAAYSMAMSLSNSAS